MGFKFISIYTGDYLRDTRHLSPTKHGIYLLLLFHYWDQQAPLTLDEQELAGITNCRSADEIEALRYVLNRYFIRAEDGWYNKRMEEEICRAEVLSKERSKAGKKGAFSRRSKSRKASKDAGSKQVLSNSSAIDKQLSVPPHLKQEKEQKQKISASGSSYEEPPADVVTSKIEATTGVSNRAPITRIIGAYHEALPDMPRMEVVNKTREGLIRQRWKDMAKLRGFQSEAEGVEVFRKFFVWIGKSRFLTGRVNPSGDRPPFVADLEWIMRPTNFAKIIEGKYHLD